MECLQVRILGPVLQRLVLPEKENHFLFIQGIAIETFLFMRTVAVPVCAGCIGTVFLENNLVGSFPGKELISDFNSLSCISFPNDVEHETIFIELCTRKWRPFTRGQQDNPIFDSRHFARWR
jgi:hypothetical protein